MAQAAPLGRRRQIEPAGGAARQLQAERPGRRCFRITGERGEGACQIDHAFAVLIKAVGRQIGARFEPHRAIAPPDRRSAVDAQFEIGGCVRQDNQGLSDQRRLVAVAGQLELQPFGARLFENAGVAEKRGVKRYLGGEGHTVPTQDLIEIEPAARPHHRDRARRPEIDDQVRRAADPHLSHLGGNGRDRRLGRDDDFELVHQRIAVELDFEFPAQRAFGDQMGFRLKKSLGLR